MHALFILLSRHLTTFSLPLFLFTHRYGIFIPSLLYLPFYLIQMLDLRNSVFNIVIGGAFALQAVRCISAIHGTVTPKSIIDQRRNNCFIYCIYFCSIVDLKYDIMTGDFLYIPPNQRLCDFWMKVKKLVFGIIQLTIMYSFMDSDSINYKPFQQPQQLGQNILDWKHLVNNMCFAYIWHLCLLTGATAFQLVIGLCTGIQSTALTNNPLFGSSSPSDFWGRRWNNVVHKVLKVRMNMKVVEIRKQCDVWCLCFRYHFIPCSKLTTFGISLFCMVWYRILYIDHWFHIAMQQ